MPPVDPHTLTLDPSNARKHGARSQEAIKRSLRDLGAGRSIVVDADGVAIAGNGVLEQALALELPVRVIETDGDTLVVVRRTDLATDDPRRVALALADNQLGQLSSWDEERLAAARATLDADLLAVTALPPDLPEPSTPPADAAETGDAAAGDFRFGFGGYRADLTEATFRAIIASIPGNGDPQAITSELRRRIGL